ncbi:hypothetical protein D3C78_1535540 [compost metagenome]
MPPRMPADILITMPNPENTMPPMMPADTSTTSASTSSFTTTDTRRWRAIASRLTSVSRTEAPLHTADAASG